MSSIEYHKIIVPKHHLSVHLYSRLSQPSEKYRSSSVGMTIPMENMFQTCSKPVPNHQPAIFDAKNHSYTLPDRIIESSNHRPTGFLDEKLPQTWPSRCRTRFKAPSSACLENKGEQEIMILWIEELRITSG